MKIQRYLDKFYRLAIPNVVTIIVNAVRGGTRIILRSTIQLLRSTMLTRILSCISVFIIDIVDLSKKRISIIQFIRNLVLSLFLILFGTIGWNMGAKLFPDGILGALVGAAVVSMVASTIMDKFISLFIKNDAQYMIEIINDCLIGHPEPERNNILKQISPLQLKKMFASNDRKVFAYALINDINSNELNPP